MKRNMQKGPGSMKGLAQAIDVVKARLLEREKDAPTSCKLEKVYVFLVLPMLRSVFVLLAGRSIAHEIC